MCNPKIRICVIRHGYFPQDPRVRKEVCALLEEGYEVHVICLRDINERPFELWCGVRIYRLPIRHKRQGLLHYLFEYLGFFILAFLKVSILQQKHRYSLVQVNTMPDFLIFAAILPRLMGAKVVLDMHELMPEFFAARFKFPIASLLIRLIKLVERMSIWIAHRIIVVSPLQAAILEQRGINKQHVIVPNVPDEALFSQVHRQCRDNTSEAILVTHGTIVERYGVQVVIEALPHILRKILVKLYVIGDGELLGDLKKKTMAMGLQEHVIFTGRVPLEKVPSYLSRATVGIVPLLKDGYIELASPNKLFEYIALRKPVLAADVPGIRVYFDEHHVEFFRPGDPEDLARKAIALLKDSQRRAQLAAQAWEVYETIRWERTKAVYKKLFLDLLNTKTANSLGAGDGALLP